MKGAEVLAAAGAVVAMLHPRVLRRWTSSVPGLDFTVASVLAHAAEGPLWYAVDLWGGPGDDAAFELRVRPDGTNPQLVTSLLSAARLCAAAVDAAPQGTRGFHPHGAADPEGFAAMACDELLVHGWDAARGLGARLDPDPDLAGAVLARLFPWHDAGDDPWRTLLWANGRLDLPDAPRRRRWVWHSAPLAEWDGQIPDA